MFTDWYQQFWLCGGVFRSSLKRDHCLLSPGWRFVIGQSRCLFIAAHDSHISLNRRKLTPLWEVPLSVCECWPLFSEGLGRACVVVGSRWFDFHTSPTGQQGTSFPQRVRMLDRVLSPPNIGPLQSASRGPRTNQNGRCYSGYSDWPLWYNSIVIDKLEIPSSSHSLDGPSQQLLMAKSPANLSSLYQGWIPINLIRIKL